MSFADVSSHIDEVNICTVDVSMASGTLAHSYKKFSCFGETSVGHNFFILCWFEMSFKLLDLEQ